MKHTILHGLGTYRLIYMSCVKLAKMADKTFSLC